MILIAFSPASIVARRWPARDLVYMHDFECAYGQHAGPYASSSVSGGYPLLLLQEKDKRELEFVLVSFKVIQRPSRHPPSPQGKLLAVSDSNIFLLFKGVGRFGTKIGWFDAPAAICSHDKQL